MDLHLDYETYSEVNIMTQGAYRYAEDPSTEVLCAAWAEDDGDPSLWHPGKCDLSIKRALKKADRIIAHNAGFEYLITNLVAHKQLGWPKIHRSQLVDTAAIAAYSGYPRALGHLSKALDLTDGKDTEGKRLINKLSKPRKPSKNNPATRWTPETAQEDFLSFYAYCMQDVRAEQEVHQLLGELPPREQELWQLDHEINCRGIPVNEKVVDGAIHVVNELTTQYQKEAVRGKPFTTLGQRDKVMAWCEVKGFALRDYKADTIQKAIKKCPIPAVKKILEARQNTSRTSLKKFKKIKGCLCRDSTVKGSLLYYGAHTGRWAGRLIQPHSLAKQKVKPHLLALGLLLLELRDTFLFRRSYDNPIEALVSCIRPTIQGKFFCGDYANIEGRVLFAVAQEQAGLKVFRAGRDLYIEMASEIYSKPYEEITSDERAMGKMAILGLGYQMAWKKFQVTSDRDWGKQITAEFSKRVVAAYRRKFSKVVQLWYDTEEAVMLAIRNPRKKYKVGPVTWYRTGTTLICILPSGRKLFYRQVAIRMMPAPWGGMKETICYMTPDDKKGWVLATTFGGKLTENIVQAIARDLLADALLRLRDAGYIIYMHIHDEILAWNAKGTLKAMLALMAVKAAWAKRWPIEVDGWEGTRFRK